MEIENIVNKKLLEEAKCISAVLASYQEDGGKSTRVVALIYCQGDSGVFLYSCNSYPPQSPDDLTLVQGIPVDSNLTFSIIGQPNDGKVPFKLADRQNEWVFEFPSDGLQVNLLLSELKESIAVKVKNSNHGLPPSFSWIDRHKPIQPFRNSNPFAEDKFDPTKHYSMAVESLDKDRNNRSTSYHGYTEYSPVVTPDNGTEPKGKPSKSPSMDDLDVCYQGGKPLKGREITLNLLMKERQNEYTDVRYFNVFCGTWNVNGQPATQQLHSWLSCDSEPPDIYALGFQELDLSKNAFIFTESPREEEWYSKCEAALHPGAKYIKFRLIRLVGMMLIIFIQEKHKRCMTTAVAESVGTGIMGMMGNKGGVAVRMEFHNTSICFVNSHLAAHTEEFERRNQDYRDINSRMKLLLPENNPMSIHDHDIVFWIGDLNYRLSNIDIDMVKKHIQSGSYQKLMQHDQLFQQKNNKQVFLDYTEADITFQPTYKYDPGTDKWDTSEKSRTPAWCDRILWRGENVEIQTYRSHMDLKLSDHKPVSAVFLTGVKVEDAVRKKKIYEDILKQMDKRENDFLPQATLDKLELSFTDIKFIERKVCIVTVTNTGQVPVQYEFINKLDETRFCKPWLQIIPSKDVIPTHESRQIQFQVYVGPETAANLNSGDDKIEDIVVLHLDGGKDFFLTISGNYIPSSFGSSLEALTQMFGPIRDVPVAKLIDLEHQTSGSSPNMERPLDVPKEIWVLVNHIYKYGLQQEDLFQQSGLHTEEEAIREALDTGSRVYTEENYKLPGSIHSVAEALLWFLKALPEPVVPRSYLQKCLEGCNNYTLCKQVLSLMPVCHQTVFKYLTAFLRTLLRHSTSNNLDSKILASLFGKLLLRSALDGQATGMSGTSNRRSQQENEDRKKAAFVYQFIVNDSLD